MAEIETRAGRVEYVERGSGPALLLLHATLHDRHDYDPILATLSESFRTLTVDWPGHGGSEKAEEPSAHLFADVLEDIVDGLDLGDVRVIGNSVGGFAAARLAIRRPEQVSGLVLVNSGGFNDMNAVARGVCRTMGTPAVFRRLSRGFVHTYMQSANELDRAIERRAIAKGRTSEGLRIASGLWKSFAEPAHDLRKAASQIKAPTLVVWGTRDRTQPLSAGRTAQRVIPGAELVTLPTGHVVFSSDPDGFLEAVVPFLEGTT